MAKTATVTASADWTPEKGAQAMADLEKAPSSFANLIAKGVAKAFTDKNVADSLEKMRFDPMTVNDVYKYGIGMPDDETRRIAAGMKRGGKVKAKTKMSSASKRADGIAQRGKTRGRMV